MDRFYRRALDLGPNPEALAHWAVGRLSRDGVLTDLDVVCAAPDPSNEALFEHWRLCLLLRDFAAARAALERGPERLTTQWVDCPRTLLLGILDDVTGNKDAAKREFETARAILEADVAKHGDDSRLHAALGHALAGLDRRDDALREGRLATELLPISRDSIVGSERVLDRLFIELRVGAIDDALKSVEEYLSNPSQLSMRALALDPRLDTVKNDPRFQALKKRFATP